MIWFIFTPQQIEDLTDAFYRENPNNDKYKCPRTQFHPTPYGINLLNLFMAYPQLCVSSHIQRKGDIIIVLPEHSFFCIPLNCVGFGHCIQCKFTNFKNPVWTEKIINITTQYTLYTNVKKCKICVKMYNNKKNMYNVLHQFEKVFSNHWTNLPPHREVVGLGQRGHGPPMFWGATPPRISPRDSLKVWPIFFCTMERNLPEKLILKK